MATETERTRPKALFMAFGTQGDVYPIAAIAAAFACDQKQYSVFLVTHSAHQNLGPHLAEKNVTYVPVLSPPVFSVNGDNDATGTLESLFSLKKRMITTEHRRECLSTVERIFGHDPSMEGDFILINFFALEGWNLAELFCIRCVVAAPYVVPYSAPASFEHHFKKDLPLLYKYLQEAPTNKVCWKDVIHWMWPLFTEQWGSWRNDDLNLSPCPFTDPVTGLPTWHDRPSSPLLLYGFSKAIVECPDYWPENVHICGFWFLPVEWQFSCKNCGEASSLVSSGYFNKDDRLCSAHIQLLSFVNSSTSMPPIFIGLSSIGSMGYMKNPQLFLKVLQIVLEISSYRFILFTAAYEPLDAAIEAMADKSASNSSSRHYSEAGTLLFDSQLFCFSGTIPYRWLFPRCAAAIHHGGSGSTAAALHAGIPQVLCPFMLDQFYWAERMYWLGVGPEPLRRNHLLPDTEDDVKEAANMLSRAIHNTLSPQVKARSLEIAERISLEDGVLEAVKKLKEEMDCSN